MLRGFAVTQSSMTNYCCWGEKTMLIKGENSSNSSEDLHIFCGKITPEGIKHINVRSRDQKVKVDFFPVLCKRVVKV